MCHAHRWTSSKSLCTLHPGRVGLEKQGGGGGARLNPQNVIFQRGHLLYEYCTSKGLHILLGIKKGEDELQFVIVTENYCISNDVQGKIVCTLLGLQKARVKEEYKTPPVTCQYGYHWKYSASIVRWKLLSTVATQRILYTLLLPRPRNIKGVGCNRVDVIVKKT